MVSRRLWLLAQACLLCVAATAARGETVLVKAGSLTVREKPNVKSKKVDALVTYDLVQVKNRQGDWSQVETKLGKVGWVLSTYLSVAPFVTVQDDNMGIRRGPGGNYSVVMKVAKNYPFKVLERTGEWLLVADFDGDRGWISGKFVSFSPYVITRLEKCNVRQGPSTENKIAFTAERGVLFKVVEQKKGWLKIKHSDGDEGWVSPKIVFGWLENEDADPAST